MSGHCCAHRMRDKELMVWRGLMPHRSGSYENTEAAE